MSDFKSFLTEKLRDPEFRREYDALEPEFALVQALIDARKSSGLTQKELSARTGIAQSDISKFENGDGNPLRQDPPAVGGRDGNAGKH